MKTMDFQKVSILQSMKVSMRSRKCRHRMLLKQQLLIVSGRLVLALRSSW